MIPAPEFTPGPWKAIDLRRQKNGQIRIWFDGDPQLLRDGTVNVHLANVLAGNKRATGDARLIAAAPDLLEVARGVLAINDNHDRHTGLYAVSVLVEQARAALAKAVQP